jgi:hypothetical protein
MRRRPKRMGYHRRRPSLPCSGQPVFGVGLFHQLQRRRCVALRVAHMPLDRSGDGPRGNPTVKSAAAHHMGSVMISRQCLIGWLAYTCSSVNKNESSESTPSNLTESNQSTQVHEACAAARTARQCKCLNRQGPEPREFQLEFERLKSVRTNEGCNVPVARSAKGMRADILSPILVRNIALSSESSV